MGRFIGPDPIKGHVLGAEQYADLWQQLYGQPRNTLKRVLGRLRVLLSDEWREGEEHLLNVYVRPGSGEIYCVHGGDTQTLLAKALALSIDRRLVDVSRARSELDTATEGIADGLILLTLERLILEATVPNSVRLAVGQLATPPAAEEAP